MNKENKNEEKLATALLYTKEDGAPKVIASGKNNIANKIIEQAKENKISIYKDKELAHMLKNLEVGDAIPPSLYNVVAQVLMFIGEVDTKVAEKIRTHRK